jgi:hypothetical protein
MARSDSIRLGLRIKKHLCPNCKKTMKHINHGEKHFLIFQCTSVGCNGQMLQLKCAGT